ncbi:hypothetical protein O181_043201 [Austropuccinia psidii MF-1]|uniref:Uncharacterized protein n=1 Tax=Austropuccinia psidii MF-1 TaxID=1389203 RepID=A0A9Q3HFS2_9BASI|nr:hypothetical protein [Austropuccinia psidii MF-1]
MGDGLTAGIKEGLVVEKLGEAGGREVGLVGKLWEYWELSDFGISWQEDEKGKYWIDGQKNYKPPQLLHHPIHHYLHHHD